MRYINRKPNLTLGGQRKMYYLFPTGTASLTLKGEVEKAFRIANVQAPMMYAHGQDDRSILMVAYCAPVDRALRESLYTYAKTESERVALKWLHGVYATWEVLEAVVGS